MIKTILAAVDGSAHSKKALEFACEMACKFDARLHILHVTQQPMSDHVLTLGAASIMVSGTQADLKKAGRQVVEAAEDIAHNAGCRETTADVMSGDPAKGIVDTAKAISADVLVMGTRGLSELSGMLLGSVSHKVTHLAPCTCITIR